MAGPWRVQWIHGVSVVGPWCLHGSMVGLWCFYIESMAFPWGSHGESMRSFLHAVLVARKKKAKCTSLPVYLPCIWTRRVEYFLLCTFVFQSSLICLFRCFGYLEHCTE